MEQLKENTPVSPFRHKGEAKMNVSLRTFLLSLCCFSISAHAQQTITIRGTIADESGEAVIGANIIVEGKAIGTTTDFDGKYSLSAPSDGLLKISYIGYLPQSVPINNRTIINVVLQEDNKQLEEVVVVGYGKMKKSDLTGSIASVP